MPERPFLIATARLPTPSIPTTSSPVSWDDPFGLQPAPESPRNRVKSARKSLVFKDSWDDFRLPAGFDPPNLLKLRHFAGYGRVSRTSPRSSQETHARRAVGRLHDVRIAVVGFLPVPTPAESLVQAARQRRWRSETAKVATSHIVASAAKPDSDVPFIDDPNGTTAQRSAKPERASASSLSKEPPPAFRSSGLYSPPQKTSEIRRKDEATRRSSFPAGRALARSAESGENFRDHLVAATNAFFRTAKAFRATPTFQKFPQRLSAALRTRRKKENRFAALAQRFGNFASAFSGVREIFAESRKGWGTTRKSSEISATAFTGRKTGQDSGRNLVPPGTSLRPPGRNGVPPGTSLSPPGRNLVSPGTSLRPDGRYVAPPGTRCRPPGRSVVPPGTRYRPPGRNMVPPGTSPRPPGRAGVPPAPGVAARPSKPWAAATVVAAPPPACPELATPAACSLGKLYTRPRS
jgi:hypothetical protein